MKSFYYLLGGPARKVLACLEGGGEFRTRDFPILWPPLPVINDQSLTAHENSRTIMILFQKTSDQRHTTSY